MKNNGKKSLVLATSIAIAAIVGLGCHRPERHVEIETRGRDGEVKHEETKIYKNADGTTVIEKEKRVTN